MSGEWSSEIRGFRDEFISRLKSISKEDYYLYAVDIERVNSENAFDPEIRGMFESVFLRLNAGKSERDGTFLIVLNGLFVYFRYVSLYESSGNDWYLNQGFDYARLVCRHCDVMSRC